MNGKSSSYFLARWIAFYISSGGWKCFDCSIESRSKNRFCKSRKCGRYDERSEAPEEWIILGCHFDAWGFGATDPNSGTAMLLSLSETLGKIKKKALHQKDPY